MTKSNFFITGATGLIGSALIRRILRDNDLLNTENTVYALIRSEEKAKSIFKDAFSRSDIKWIKGDLNNIPDFDEKIDYIFHCASVTTSKTMVEKPVETIMTAVVGTKNILELAKNKGVTSFVYISSMEMYGSFGSGNDNVTENQIGTINPLAVRSNYPESKRLCENMCVAYFSEYGVPVKIARLSQTFGPGILPGENRVFAQFARSAIKGENIVLHTKGLSEGNYCYIDDCIDGLFTIANKGANGEAYNVSNPEAHMTIADMAQMVSAEFGKGKTSVIFDIDENNSHGYAQTTKMKLNSDKLQALGWKPRVSLQESYERLINYMLDNPELI